MTELNDAVPILLSTINDFLRHPDYVRVNEIADDYTIYVTGENVEKKLKQFNGRESDEMFKQRVRLTQPLTQDMANSLMNPMFKVGRTPAKKSITWGKEKDSEEKKKQLVDIANKYYGNTSVEDYLTYRMVELDSTDPNSFIVTEFKESVDPRNPQSKANPYPFEVNSKEAINYVFKNNTLQWLIVLNPLTLRDIKGKEVPGEKYYMYLDNENIIATQIHRDNLDAFKAANSVVIVNEDNPIDNFSPNRIYLFNTNEKTESKRRYYAIEIAEHKIGVLPAIRVGTKRDLATRGRTCVPIIHPAKSYFEKSIKIVSEFDLTMCLHTFPQKIQYSDPCQGVGVGTDHYVGCNGGMAMGIGGVCQACNGSGYKVHTSSQDVLQIRMPRDIKDMVSLENVIAYKAPPIDLIEFQKKMAFDTLRSAAQSAVYNSDVFTDEQVQVTATEKSIDLDAVYDTLKPFASQWSNVYVHTMKCIASIRDMADGLEISHDFPDDFKMKSFSELLLDLKLASENNAPSHIKEAITTDITRKVYVDQPEEVRRIETKQKYFPFNGKTEEEILFILASDLSTEYYKCLYVNFDAIFADLEYEANQKGLNFYQMEETMQRTLIEAKVKEFQDEKSEDDTNNNATLLKIEDAA